MFPEVSRRPQRMAFRVAFVSSCRKGGNTAMEPLQHGFLVQMGGFVLTDNGMPIQAMSYSKAWLEKDDDISEYIAKHKGRRDPCDGIKN